MGRYTGPRLKKMRALGVELPGLSRKSIAKRPHKPGEHGQTTQRPKDYKLRLLEKQKLRFNYGISERQLRRIVREAVKSKTLTDDKIIELLERRLDNVVFRGGLAPTIPAARQLVNHNHMTVNNKRVNIASYRVKVGDVIQSRERSMKLEPIQVALLDGPQLNLPEWLEFDETTASIRILALPNADAVPFPLEMSLVIEFYSRLL
ncbi:30S ribosomal protein S4 [Candidatus Poribacteria bacterium]|nr:MAG: 30S ribosomal protein S4 [Candidatus Poribacteria bacterium]